jgi:hypothetical protein
MKRRFLFGSYLLMVTATVLASSSAPVYSAAAARREVPGPTYMNAEVIRVDAEGGTITLKSDRGETAMLVEGEARAELSCLREKDKVIVTSHLVDDGAGGSRRVVIQVSPASQGSGEPARPPLRKAASATSMIEPVVSPPVTARAARTPRTIDRASIVSIEPAANRITVKDSLGRTHVLIVQQHARQDLGVLGPDDVVTLGVQGNPEQVFRITRDVVAATPAHFLTISESAAQDFESNVARLAPQANAIDGLWLGFQEVCLTEPPVTNRSRGWFQLLDGTIPEPDQDGCRQQYKEMISRGERVREFLTLAEEAARKAEVAPGRLRATLERHRLDF